MNDSVFYVHILSIYAMLAILLRNIYLLFMEKNFIRLSKKIKFITPAFHIMHSVVIFTGLLMEFFFKIFSYSVHFMVLISIIIIILEIKRYKKMRVIRSYETKLQQKFINFAKKIYTIELTAISIFIIGHLLKSYVI